MSREAIRVSLDYMTNEAFVENLKLSWFFKKSKEYASICDAIARHLHRESDDDALLTLEEAYAVQQFIVAVCKRKNYPPIGGIAGLYWRKWYWRSRLNFLEDVRDEFYQGDYSDLY